MFRLCIFCGSLAVFFLVTSHKALSQASTKLDEKTKAMESAQQKSWQQVDEINKETDNTKARRQQAQSAAHNAQKSGYSVKKTSISTKGVQKKSTLKHKASTKKD